MQHDYVIDNQTSSQFRVDLNNALAAIVSQNSGDTEPATPFASQVWYDTLNNLLKQRNESNSAWITLGTVNEGTGKFEPNQTFATQAEAEAGTVDTVAMTPLKTAQAIAALSTSGGGGYDYQAFTATGTWTKPVGASADAVVRIQMWAGGGGGGKGDSTNTAASGGGGGGFVQFELPVASLGATESVTIGAGGTGGGTGNAGGTGGTSTFAGISIYGGAGGLGGSTSGNRHAARGGSWIQSSVAINGSGAGSYLDGGVEVSPDQFGGGCGNYAVLSTVGAFWGGGGGKNNTSSGVTLSRFGGSGGAAATAGTAPAGGGGGRTYVNNSTTGGAGARGEVRIYTTW
jgi:hypothetical protein